MASAAPEDNYACRIIRSNRPCLVCPGQMDLVEAHPRFSLFSGLPLCSSETIDCLDCPRCGFSTSTTDYEYLQICKIQRHGMFYGSGRDRKSSYGRSSSRRDKGSNSPTSSSSGSGRMCTNCNASLSSKWQFCPGCGSKCGASTPTSSISVPPVVTQRTERTSFKEQINSPSDTSMDCGDSSAATRDSGIMRMVTPPKRHSSGDTDRSQGSL
jgi:hypothetical protein